MERNVFFSMISLLPCMVCLFWSINILVKIKTNYRFQNILAICMLMCGIEYYIIANFYSGITNYVLYGRLDLLDTFVTLLVYPCMYFYYKTLTKVSIIRWYDYLIFIPSIITSIGATITYFSFGEAQIALSNKEVILNLDTFSSQYAKLPYKAHYFFSIKMYNIILIIQAISIISYATFSLIKYHNKLLNFFSSAKEKYININLSVLILFVLTIVFTFVFVLYNRTTIKYNTIFSYIFFIGSSIIFFSLCYQSSKISYSAEKLEEEIKQTDIEVINIKKEEDNIGYIRYINNFNRVVNEDLIFIQKNLRINDVAKAALTNRTYISRIINEEYGCNFSEFINNKRIEYAKNLMKENPRIKQETLAEELGFTHASAFNRCFKKTTGMTPKEWIRVNSITYVRSQASISSNEVDNTDVDFT